MAYDSTNERYPASAFEPYMPLLEDPEAPNYTDVAATPAADYSAPAPQAVVQPPQSQVPAARGLVNPGEWVYAGSRMPGEAPVQFPTEPPVAGQMPYGISRYDLPGGVRAYHVSQDYQERQRQLDQQAAAARQAAQQAAMDAHLLDQMSRVARSTKDIETMRRNIDIMALTRELQNAPPDQQHQVLMRHPLALGSGYGAAMHYSAPVTPPTVVPPSGTTPGYIQDPRGVPHFFPGSGQQPAHKLGELIPVKDPQTGELIANVIATGPQTGHVEKASTANLTPSQQVQVHRARISALNAQLNLDYQISDKATREKAITQHTAELAAIGKELADMSVRAAPKIAAPRSTVAVPGQGTREDPARPETDEQFKSLPSGAVYRNPKDGKLYRKK